ncbi:DUF6551 family protein [Devosia sp.]|uniref:DUF6551 family protein n=1 Tax=Devosia sp. TaxID=1871048 RepID=UPI001AC6F03F|nr:DUF6551 family protein [Devosia sp.]MBN9335289.1 ParB N-terminal domain-containing protein [Devosia sp.]
MTETEFRDPGEVPVIDWLDKNLIDIDPTYQRGLDEARVQKIVDWFAWDSFGAIVVAPAEEGRYHAIDGQHRLEAAKRHPKVDLLPAVIIVGRGLVAEAETFVNVNGARKNVSPLEMYWAQLTAGDPEAETVKQVCERAGVKLLRYPGSNGKYAVSETVAIAALRGLIDKRGAMKSRKLLEVLVAAELKPITAIQIKAAALLAFDPEFAEHLEPEAISEAMRGAALAIEGEANAFAATHRLPKTKAFASVWFKRCRKKRKIG